MFRCKMTSSHSVLWRIFQKWDSSCCCSTACNTHRHAHHFSTLSLSLGVFHNGKLVHQSALQRTCKCMEAVGRCPSKRLLRGPAFFPDVRQLVLLQHTGQRERSFLKKEIHDIVTLYTAQTTNSGSSSVDGKCFRIHHTDYSWHRFLDLLKSLLQRD